MYRMDFKPNCSLFSFSTYTYSMSLRDDRLGVALFRMNELKRLLKRRYQINLVQAYLLFQRQMLEAEV